MPWRQMGDERHAAKRNRVAIVQDSINRVRLAARFHALERGHIFRHRHHLRTRQLLDQRIALLMIAVRVAAEQNLRIRKLESELLH